MKRIKLCSADELDIVKTFECGQCFRWNADDRGVYHGVASGNYAELETKDGLVYITTDADESFWRDYFDLGTDYAEISSAFTGEYLETCRQFGCGIRILRQEPWEALCSFIISQCNNISRIKGIVEKLCRCFGDELKAGDVVCYGFPSAERLADLTPEELAPLRAGYRAEYIITAAKAVSDGSLDLEALKRMNCRDAVKELRKLKGIGEKVANCVVLFGLSHMEAFPVDVWMKRALKENFPEGFDPESLGAYAGLAQQYIFYYARSNGK
ncbi:MAG: DNA-3-methyladenine glycosylase 2 family protein [Oscillospiraceae bacterium]|nr:DNA-3-methyladenine glycosylase 2 family protein [Oscillospiraceae bacterium]